MPNIANNYIMEHLDRILVYYRGVQNSIWDSRVHDIKILLYIINFF